MKHNLSQSEAHTNNFEIQGTSSNVSDNALTDKVINIFYLLNKKVNKNNIEDCHRLGNAVPKNTIVRFVNRKCCCEVLNLRKVDSTKFGFQAGAVGNLKEQEKFTVVRVPKGL